MLENWLPRPLPKNPRRTQQRILSKLFSHDQKLTELALSLVLWENVSSEDRVKLRNAISVNANTELQVLLTGSLSDVERETLINFTTAIKREDEFRQVNQLILHGNLPLQITLDRIYSDISLRFDELAGKSNAMNFSNPQRSNALKAAINRGDFVFSKIGTNKQDCITRWPDKKIFSFVKFAKDYTFTFADMENVGLLDIQHFENSQKWKDHVAQTWLPMLNNEQLFGHEWFLAFLANTMGISYSYDNITQTINTKSIYTYFNTIDGRDIVKALYIFGYENHIPFNITQDIVGSKVQSLYPGSLVGTDWGRNRYTGFVPAQGRI